MNLYDKLIATPIFQGMTRESLIQAVGQTKLAFMRFAPGKEIKHEGESCDRMAILIGGKAIATATSDDKSYSFEETISAPFLLQPECIFGLTQRHTRTFTAKTKCEIAAINKNDVLQLSDDFIIFRINLLNILSTLAQKSSHYPWRATPESTNKKIIRFFESHLMRPAGEKTIRIKMTRLAEETGEPRHAISAELNRMKASGLINFSRGIITIPSFESLH